MNSSRTNSVTRFCSSHNFKAGCVPEILESAEREHRNKYRHSTLRSLIVVTSGHRFCQSLHGHNWPPILQNSPGKTDHSQYAVILTPPDCRSRWIHMGDSDTEYKATAQTSSDFNVTNQLGDSSLRINAEGLASTWIRVPTLLHWIGVSAFGLVHCVFCVSLCQ